MVQTGSNCKGNNQSIGGDHGMEGLWAALQTYGENVNHEFQEIRNILANISLRLEDNSGANSCIFKDRNLQANYTRNAPTWQQLQYFPGQRKYHPKVNIQSFNGYLDSEAFLEWCSEVESYLDVLEVPLEKQAKYVARRLTGRASAWWTMLQNNRRLQGKSTVHSWKKMRRFLVGQFLPPDLQKVGVSREPHQNEQTSKTNQSDSYDRLMTGKCFKDEEFSHHLDECRSRKFVNIDEEYLGKEREDEKDCEEEIKIAQEEEESTKFVVHSLLSLGQEKDTTDCNNIFQYYGPILDKFCKPIIDNGSCGNIISKVEIDKRYEDIIMSDIIGPTVYWNQDMHAIDDSVLLLQGNFGSLNVEVIAKNVTTQEDSIINAKNKACVYQLRRIFTIDTEVKDFLRLEYGVPTRTYTILSSKSKALIMEAQTKFTGRRLLQEHEIDSNVAGQWLGWLMAAIYMGGRVPQIWLNIKRGTVEGLNPLMFVFVIVANATYVGSILVRSTEWEKIKANMPWLLDAVACVVLDLFIILQYLYYTHKKIKKRQEAHS